MINEWYSKYILIYAMFIDKKLDWLICYLARYVYLSYSLWKIFMVKISKIYPFDICAFYFLLQELKSFYFRWIKQNIFITIQNALFTSHVHFLYHSRHVSISPYIKNIKTHQKVNESVENWVKATKTKHTNI